MTTSEAWQRLHESRERYRRCCEAADKDSALACYAEVQAARATWHDARVAEMEENGQHIDDLANQLGASREVRD